MYSVGSPSPFHFHPSEPCTRLLLMLLNEHKSEYVIYEKALHTHWSGQRSADERIHIKVAKKDILQLQLCLPG